jgi:hypothetical protein
VEQETLGEARMEEIGVLTRQPALEDITPLVSSSSWTTSETVAAASEVTTTPRPEIERTWCNESQDLSESSGTATTVAHYMDLQQPHQLTRWTRLARFMMRVTRLMITTFVIWRSRVLDCMERL